MSAMMLAIIGILIASVGTVAGFVYFDMDAGNSLEGGIVVSEGMVAMAQAADSFSESSGGPPASLDDLRTVDDLPQVPHFPGASWAVGTNAAGREFVCMYAVRGNVADRSLHDASRRLGSKSFVSGECAKPGTPGDVIVLSYPIGA